MNFVRVLKWLFVSRFLGNSRMGGERQRSYLGVFRADSAIARCTGTRSYLEPISSSMLVPLEGRSRCFPAAIYSINKGAIDKKPH
jgi:hypothetical protein